MSASVNLGRLLIVPTKRAGAVSVARTHVLRYNRVSVALSRRRMMRAAPANTKNDTE